MEKVSSLLDVFGGSSPTELSDYRGKVLVVTGQPERVVLVADTLAEAEQKCRESAWRNQPCRFVQGPPALPMTLAELEGR